MQLTAATAPAGGARPGGAGGGGAGAAAPPPSAAAAAAALATAAAVSAGSTIGGGASAAAAAPQPPSPDDAAKAEQMGAHARLGATASDEAFAPSARVPPPAALRPHPTRPQATPSPPPWAPTPPRPSAKSSRTPRGPPPRRSSENSASATPRRGGQRARRERLDGSRPAGLACCASACAPVCPEGGWPPPAQVADALVATGALDGLLRTFGFLRVTQGDPPEAFAVQSEGDARCVARGAARPSTSSPLPSANSRCYWS